MMFARSCSPSFRLLLLLPALLLCLQGSALARANLELTQRLAQERYGAQAAQTVLAWRALIEQARPQPLERRLQLVNDFFNRRIRYTLDAQVWGVDDHWTTPLELMGRAAGDREDYAIAKYVTLQLLGVPSERLHLIYVRARTDGARTQAHMVLGYFEHPLAEPLILDSRHPSLLLVSSRPDLTPLFGFNSAGLLTTSQALPGQPGASLSVRLSRWRDVLARMAQEGL